MPALTTEKRSPNAAGRRGESALGQRSSPFRVEAVPSVMESPNATTTCVPAGASMSTASRKNQELVEKGNADSSSSWLFAPAPGAVRYEVVRAFACHVMGPLSPAMWKLTASLRPARLFEGASGTASLQTACPGSMVTAVLPAKRTGRLVPGTTAPALHWKPA